MPAPPNMPPVPSAPTHGVGTVASDAESADDTRRKFSNTLVGVPSKRPPPPPAASQVLSPPRWQGAGAYVAGQEPQPRVSSLQAPPALLEGAVPHPDTRRVPNTHITAAAPPPGSARANVAIAEEVAPPATAAIGEAIQQLLDAQTAVPQQVEEPAQEITADDVIARTSQEPDEQPDEQLDEPAVRSLPPAEAITRRPEPGPAFGVLRSEEPRHEPRVEPFATPTPKGVAPSPRWSAPSAIAARAPEPVEPVSDRELAKYSFVEQEPIAAPPVALERAAPSAPDDAHTGLGLLLAAAILVVGVGGWLITRGGFPMPKRPAIAATATAAPAVDPTLPTTAEPSLEAPVAPATLPATAAPAIVTAPAPGAAVQPSPELGDVVAVAPPPSPQTATGAAARAARPAAAKASTRANGGSEGHPGSEGAPAAAQAAPAVRAAEEAQAEPPAAQAAATDDGVLKLTPRGEPLPETPTRENVQSALDALRKPVLECAGGQRGVAEVDLTVASTGAVTHAIVAGDFAGTAAGSCIARVVRGARFAPFSKPRFRVIYPFSL